MEIPVRLAPRFSQIGYGQYGRFLTYLDNPARRASTRRRRRQVLTDSLFPENLTGILAALSPLHEVAASEFQVESGSECTRRAGEPFFGAKIPSFSQANRPGLRFSLRSVLSEIHSSDSECLVEALALAPDAASRLF